MHCGKAAQSQCITPRQPASVVKGRLPHFVSVPLLVAGSDLIGTVPATVGGIFATMALLKVIAPPLPSPMISLQQFGHRPARDDPGMLWMHRLTAALFLGRDPSPKST